MALRIWSRDMMEPETITGLSMDEFVIQLNHAAARGMQFMRVIGPGNEPTDLAVETRNIVKIKEIEDVPDAYLGRD